MRRLQTPADVTAEVLVLQAPVCFEDCDTAGWIQAYARDPQMLFHGHAVFTSEDSFYVLYFWSQHGENFGWWVGPASDGPGGQDIIAFLPADARAWCAWVDGAPIQLELDIFEMPDFPYRREAKRRRLFGKGPADRLWADCQSECSDFDSTQGDTAEIDLDCDSDLDAEMDAASGADDANAANCSTNSNEFEEAEACPITPSRFHAAFEAPATPETKPQLPRRELASCPIQADQADSPAKSKMDPQPLGIILSSIAASPLLDEDELVLQEKLLLRLSCLFGATTDDEASDPEPPAMDEREEFARLVKQVVGRPTVAQERYRDLARCTSCTLAARRTKSCWNTKH